MKTTLFRVIWVIMTWIIGVWLCKDKYHVHCFESEPTRRERGATCGGQNLGHSAANMTVKEGMYLKMNNCQGKLVC